MVPGIVLGRAQRTAAGPHLLPVVSRAGALGPGSLLLLASASTRLCYYAALLLLLLALALLL